MTICPMCGEEDDFVEMKPKGARDGNGLYNAQTKQRVPIFYCYNCELYVYMGL